MRFAVSNIAWSPEDRSTAYRALRAAGFTGLEVAPGLLFDQAADPFAPTDTEAAPRLAEIAEAGLTLVSAQSLLFGVEGAALFEGEAALGRLEAGMARAIALAGRIGLPVLVFGSPKQRVVPEGMAMEAALDHAAAVFRRLGALAEDAGTVIAMEANPEVYGTNFLNRASEALSFVERVDHPGIGLILDVGAMHINGDFDRIPAIVAAAGPRLVHVHMSEPGLAPAPADPGQAAQVIAALAAEGYDRAVSIEMKAVPGDGLRTLTDCVARLAGAARMPA